MHGTSVLKSTQYEPQYVYVSYCMRTAHKRHILAVRTYTKKFGEALLSWFDEDRACAAEISDT